METHVKSVFEVGGKKLGGFKEFRLTQVHNSHHTFELIVPLEVIEGDSTNNLLKGKDMVGEPIKVDISPEDSSKRSGQLNQFNGIVTGVSVLRHGINASDFVIRGASPTILLEDLPNTRSYSEKSVSQIVKDVLKPYPKNDLKSKVSPKPDASIDYYTQYEETNYNFLRRTAAIHGQWCYYDGKQLVFGELDSGSEEVELSMGQDLMELELGMKIEPTKFKHLSHDYVKNQPYDTASGQAKVSGLNSLGKHALSTSEKVFAQESLSYTRGYYKDKNSLKDYSVAYRSGEAGDLIIAEGTSVNARIKVGCRIKIKSGSDQKDEDYGSYTVISVTHFTNLVGSYHNSFEAIPDTVTVPPHFGGFSFPRADIQQAIVKENDDKDSLSRVRVQFAWQTGPNKTPWIRLATGHAGKNRGIQFIPEVDDEVLIAFENNNPDRPVVIGSLHHGKAKHEDRKDKDNYVKVIRTKSDNEIRFEDKGGEEQIIIQNKDSENEIRLSLKDDKILIKAKNTIEMIAKDIYMEAEKTIKMKTKDMTASTQNSMTLESQNKYEVKNVQSKTETSGKSETKVTGPMKIKGAATVDIEGTKTSVKASTMLEMNGSATAMLKGGVVMIN